MKGRRIRRPFSLGRWRCGAGFAALAVIAIAQPVNAAMRGYIVTSFDTIRVEAPVRIVLSTGGGASGMGEGERQALDRIDLAVSGGELTVRMTDAPGNDFADGKDAAAVPTIHLSTDRLRRVQVIGGGVLMIEDLSGLEADLSMNGNGELVVKRADLERLSLYVGGGGRIAIAGRTRSVRASVNGPGSLEASGLDARDASVANDGPGTIHMMVNGPAKVVSTGSGDTVVKGKPVCAVTRRGVGQVICGE